MPGLFAGSGLSLQAQPSGRAADYEDFGERPALDVVAGGAMMVRAGKGHLLHRPPCYNEKRGTD